MPGGAKALQLASYHYSMLFNSIEFAVFFPIAVLFYFLLPYRYRWIWLLAGSCYFYMAFIPIYILILFFTIIIDYEAGIAIENARGRHRKWLLALSIIANVGVLAVFKYYNFLNENLSFLLKGFCPGKSDSLSEHHPALLGFLFIRSRQ